MKDRMAVQISTQFTKDTNLQLQNCVRHGKLDMSQRHKASMFSCTFCTVPQIWGHCLQNSFTWRRCWSSILWNRTRYCTSSSSEGFTELPLLQYVPYGFKHTNVTSIQEKEPHCPNWATAKCLTPNSQWITTSSTCSYVLIRAVHRGCLNHRIEVEVLGHILGKGLTSNTEPLFYRVYIYICIIV